MANERLKQIIRENIQESIQEIIALLPTEAEIEVESMHHDEEYMGATFFARGADWVKQEIMKKLKF
jgi:hypothetical protein